MCGLVVLWDMSGSLRERDELLVEKALGKLKHRGPDESSLQSVESKALFGHTRLSIVGLEDGLQPLSQKSPKGHKMTWVHNGEIYNHSALRSELEEYKIESHSDSAVIGPGLDKWGYDIFDRLDGVFATVLYRKGEIIAARDALGVKPLYYGTSLSGRMIFASEMKALEGLCDEVHTFPAGHYYSSLKGFVKFYRPQYVTKAPMVREGAFELLNQTLRKSVKKRLMADVPVGALLSGGLDSSLVAAIASEELKKKGKVLHTFSVGLDPKSDDLKYARKVSEHIGSIHHEIIFTESEGIATLKEMIHHLETFDITTVRASTPMFLMAKKIRDLGIKVVLSGEGADEIFGGYLYFRHAPSEEEFHKECLRRIGLLYSADLLRADRATMGASVEARVPFLDKEFLEVSMSIHPSLKSCVDGRAEKWVLREAFAKDDLIPNEILWRQKEQFSDGVGYSWVDRLKDHAEGLLSDEDLLRAKSQYKYLPPITKEALLYRRIFTELFCMESIGKQCKAWVPKWQKNTDPSGRANKDHFKSTEESTLPLAL